INSVISVKVLEIDPVRKSGVVSYNQLQRQLGNAARQQEIDSIQEGQILKGEVVKFESYGAFIKFNNVTGLLRLREIDFIRVNNPVDYFKLGDIIEVKVLSNTNGRIDLSRKALLESPFNLYIKDHKVSDVVKAKVHKKMPYGVLLTLADNLDGLLHESEFSWNPNENLLPYLKLEEEIEVAIIAIDEKTQKISLSKKALIDNPWSRVNAQNYDEIECTVSEITPKGLVIQALGVDGFIPTSEIILDQKSSKLEDYFAVGDTVKGIILEVNPKQWILKVSLKKQQENESRKEFENYMEKQQEEEVNTNLGDIFKDVLK
ncbi:MAG: S1 RNA-binding domain-containing protein, partial [Anaeroplasmataceae bacterium]